MSYTFVNRPSVKADLANATDYYKKISTQLAKQFLLRVRQAKTAISQTPIGFQIKYNGVRTILLEQFPYHIHYIINDSKKEIVILAIIHAVKEPDDYSKR